MSHETSTQVLEVVTKAAPGAGLGVPMLLGYTINEAAAMIGILYSVTAFGFMLWDRYKKWRNGNGCDK